MHLHLMHIYVETGEVHDLQSCRSLMPMHDIFDILLSFSEAEWSAWAITLVTRVPDFNLLKTESNLPNKQPMVGARISPHFPFHLILQILPSVLFWFQSVTDLLQILHSLVLLLLQIIICLIFLTSNLTVLLLKNFVQSS